MYCHVPKKNLRFIILIGQNLELLGTSDTIVIGDTMDTDIQGGVQMGYRTILVLSGITKKEELNHYAFKPDLIVGSVKDIKFPLKWWKPAK